MPLLAPLSRINFMRAFYLLDWQADANGLPLPAVEQVVLHHSPDMEPLVMEVVMAANGNPKTGQPPATLRTVSVRIEPRKQPGWGKGEWWLEVVKRYSSGEETDHGKEEQ